MTTPEPIAHPLAQAPRFLLDWPTWAAWTAPIKKPLDLRRFLRPAATDDPDTWAPPSSAQSYLQRAARLAPPSLPLPNGVGILIAPPLVFVDFDDVLTDDRTTPPEWVSLFIQRAADIGAYTEWSGSGSGLHALIRTSPAFPTLTRNRYTRTHPAGPIGIEVYSHHRFAALTGFQVHPASPSLNDPAKGDDLLRAFIADLGHTAAPILTQPLGPISVPPPTARVREVARELADIHQINQAFTNPTDAYSEWQDHRALRSLDTSLSAWRFYLYGVAARYTPASPAPLYELFHPHDTPAHPGIPEWQEFSGYLRKKHRVYSDIQRAHALQVEEQRLLALDLGEPPPPAPSRTSPPRHPANVDLVQSWEQLGLVMKVTRNSAVPVVGTVNFQRILAKHPHFQNTRIERNQLDGTTRVNRLPILDTFATRALEPLRTILDLPSDPPVQGVRDAIEVVADDNPYDPLVEYLRGLAPYTLDEPSHLSTWLSEIGAAHDPDIGLYSRRILLGLVARAIKPGVKFDYVPVFEGPTGVGKSTLVAAIVTEPFFSVMPATDLQSKDAKIALRGKWGMELAEMSAFKKTDEESRKAFFSTATDSFRPPYGRANVDIARRCVLFGTTEDKQYLSDWRGNRRYWPIYFPSEIDIPLFLSMRDRLFAEALYYFEKGERFHDSVEEMKSPDRLAALESHLITPAWQVKVIEHLKSLPLPHIPSEDGTGGNSGMLTTQYIADLQRTLDLPNAVQHMSDAQLAKFLQRAGYHSHPISYRHDGLSKKTYGWAHPALTRLTPEQTKAFLSFFPHLFPRGEVPQPWIEARPEHLDSALKHLGGSQ